jgi:uncharacterized protein (DUF58 family)
MFYPKPVAPFGEEFNKIKFSVYAAAALIELFRRQRDAVGLSVFSEQLDVQTGAKSSQAHHRFLYDQLERLLNTVGEEQQLKTNAVDALHEIAEVTHKRSLVLLFTDMFDNSSKRDELFSALQHLRHNKHEVVLFHVVDKKTELDFDLQNRPYTFFDIESGEEVKANPADVREHYLRQISALVADLRNRCGQYGIDFVEADVQKGLNPILLQYLIKRQKLH